MMRLALIVLLACGVAGCFKAQAKTPPTPVALLTPPPPERLIVPVPPPEPEPPAPAAPTAGTTPPRTPPSVTPPQRPAPAAPAAAAPPAATAETPPAQPPVLLQTTTNPETVRQRANDLIAAATRDLDLINLAVLSANARAQYQTARGFVRQAQEALKVSNVVLARELADKAVSLATQLRR